MAINGMSEENRLEAVRSTLKEMETLAARIRNLIVRQPPHELLGYIYNFWMLDAFHKTEATGDNIGNESEVRNDTLSDSQFLLEYVHAALASTTEQKGVKFDENACTEVFECAMKLKNTAMYHAMFSSANTDDGAFGSSSPDVMFLTLSKWISLRGNRYQVLEGEFYEFVLKPHDKILRDTYGIGAGEISAGFQDMSNAIRTGQASAADEIARQTQAVHEFARSQSKSFDDVVDARAGRHDDDLKVAATAFDDLLRGGICNVSRHTSLPSTFLNDLSYSRGEETEFYAEGPYAGTPLRTLPVRKKPLIKLCEDYYAVDPCFIRDAGYRALLHNLLQRHPEYKKEFEIQQKAMSESAFFKILDIQFKGAKINQEIWYKDPVTRQWVENNTLIRINDVLILVEAKAGAAATIASPALDFPRHVLAVRDLIVKAYTQCKRFFEYLRSAAQVPIFERRDGRYVECDQIRIDDYRLLVPIGLTVESFSPFSTSCKELPEITPLLGKHAFVSLSVDDLFVLKRFLPTMGEFAHYLEVRQALAGIKGAFLFDEFDHLGSYIEDNRFDLKIAETMAKERAEMVVWLEKSAVIDRYFAGDNFEEKRIPAQSYPDELLGLLGALNNTRTQGWLSAESLIRNFSEDERKSHGQMMADCRASLSEHRYRYFGFGGSQPMLIWLQRIGTTFSIETVKDKASAAALAANADNITVIVTIADPIGGYRRAESFTVPAPALRTAENASIFEDADRMRAGRGGGATDTPREVPVTVRRPARNEPCWCGSRIKFKKCHGR